MQVDAHQHFWKYDPVRDSWITEDMSAIRKDFLPSDLGKLLNENDMNGCITVQSDQSEAENDFQLANANHHDFIMGIVGWVDLQSPDVEKRLEHYSQFRKMKGFRHVLQGEQQRDMMLNDAFKRGIGLLHKYGFTYDILIYPDQLSFSKELVSLFPDQKFVIDHLAKPDIRAQRFEGWKENIAAFKPFENVYCKVSGMVTEADWKNWNLEDFKPYLDVIVQTFGTDRIMFGSDWPVCLVAASYKEVLAIVRDYFSSFSKEEQQKIFGKNAINFYNI
jgi:L-fuconolactonase